MGSLFSRRPAPGNPTITPSSSPVRQIVPTQQNEPDPFEHIQSLLTKSGGDARTAFYMAAKEKGVDGDQFIQQLLSMGDINTLFQNLVTSNPKAKILFSLLSMMK